MGNPTKSPSANGSRRGCASPAPTPPRSLNHKSVHIQAVKDHQLLEAIEVGRRRFGDQHPLVKAALRQLRSNERRRHGAVDALTQAALGEDYGSVAFEVRRGKRARREAARKSNGGSHTREDVLAQYKRQDGRCFYCGVSVKGKYHVDHVVPLCKGGGDGPENLVVSCPSCNHKKSGKHPMEFCGIML